MFTIPNALTGFRLLLVPVILVLLLTGRDLLAAVVFIIAALTDFLDGRIARRETPTYLGKLMDPIADRLMISGTAIVLAIRGFLPVWAVIILITRDISAVVGGVLLRGRIQVNVVGKVATAVLMMSVAALIFKLGAIGEWIFYLGITLSLASGAMYIVTIIRRGRL